MVTEVRKMGDHHRVVFEDGTALKVPEAMFYDFRVRAGDPVDRAHYEAQLNAHAYEYALDRAGRALAARDMTRVQVEKKLLSAGYPEEAVARVMDVLTHYDFVSDERFAGRFVSGRSARYGRSRILSELRMKGVPEETARRALEDLSDEDEKETALKQGRKLCARRDLTDPDERRKAAAALVRRGFSWEIAAETIQALAGEELNEE